MATFQEKVNAVKKSKTLRNVKGEKERDLRARKIIGAMVARMKRSGKHP